MGWKRSDLRTRMERHYIPEPNSGCWIWFGGTSGPRDSYGLTQLGTKKIRAHRAMWELENGPIPEGAYLLHKCDTPACINPDHLFIGDARANVDDMKRKGRSPDLRGIKCNHAKLTEDIVRRIRADTRTLAAISIDYTTSVSNVARIKNRQSYRNIP